MAGEALHHLEDPDQGLDTHQDTTDEILSRLDDAALKDLAEHGELEDVRAVVMSLVADNPSLEPYLIDFQQQNDTALVAQLRREAANELAQPDTEHGDQANPEESEVQENIEAAKKYLYESLEIDENHENNGALTNFAKGIVDTLIFENAELAAQVIETKGQVILDALQNLATWSGIKQVLSALGESIWDLWDGDAYEKGKAVADLGLVATGVGLTAAVGRKVVKSAVKQVDIPKGKNLDENFFDDIDSLPDVERLEAAREFLRRDINEVEKQGILDAHEKGERMENGKYLFPDIKAKVEILKQAGFTPEEIRVLLDNNICGSDSQRDTRIKELNISVSDLEAIPGFTDLFDSSRGNIIKEGISHEAILDFVSGNEKLNELFSIYKAEKGKVADPDEFRSLFPEYKGTNSAEFDDIVQKLSKIYYRLQLLEIEGDINARVRLLGGAPGSGKTSSIKFIAHHTDIEPDITFDAPLSDIRFIDYLKTEAQSVGVNNIDIDIIHRDPVNAWEGIVKRAIDSRRPVGASYYIETYGKVREVMNKLADRGDGNVRFIDNSGAPQDVKQVGINDINTYPTALSKGELDRITKRMIETSINNGTIDLETGTLLRNELLK